MGANDPAQQIPLIHRWTNPFSRRNQQRGQQQRQGNGENKSHVLSIDHDKKGSGKGNKRLLTKADSVRQRYPQPSDVAQGFKYAHKLLELVENENYDEVRALLEDGETDINVGAEGTKLTALHIAAMNGYVGILKLLVDQGADVNAQDSTEQTPLHLATRKDFIGCCRMLLENDKIDINKPNKEHNTALHIAAKEGRYNVCDMILDHEHVKVNIKNKKGMTALHLAAQENHPDVLSLLLERGGIDWKIKDTNFYLALHYAAQKGFPECCQVLMSTDIRDQKEKQLSMVLKDGKTALMLAAKNGHHKCCEKLMVSNINAKDRSGFTALHYATTSGFEITVSELLTMGANPNTQNNKGCAPILDAAAKKRPGCLNTLIEKDANPIVFDKEKKGVIHYAAEKNAEECMRILLDIPAVLQNLDMKDKNSCTALHLAIKREAVECAFLLLEKGSSFTEECGGGYTPLHLAADKGYTIICEKLLSNPEVQVSKEANNKATPLHLAALHGSVDVCQMLLRKGARQTAVDVHGRTALHLASGKGNVNVVKFLSRKGVPNKAKDDTGSNALHLAAASEVEGALDCCKILATNARGLNWDMDRDKKLPIDRAFENKHDEIFSFLLKKLVYKEKQDERILTLHKYMHEALEGERLHIVEAIIDSDWWEAGFTGENGHHCQNFRTLVVLYPDLALKIQDKCVKLTDSGTVYDFRLYNDNFYIPSSSEKDTKKLALSPFDSETGLVLKEAHHFTENLDWKNSHPLTLMVSHVRHQNLQHPLSKAWMLQKWRSSAYKIFLSLLIHEFILVGCLLGFMGCIENWNHIKTRCNLTQNEFYNIAEEYKNLSLNSSNEIMTQFENCISPFPIKMGLWIALGVIMCLTLMLEINYLYRLKQEYFKITGNYVRIMRFICTLIILIPHGMQPFNYLIQNDLQWQFGIAALLLAWLHLINTLNELPMFSVFMPITHSFMKSFFKVLFYIVMLVFIFAFIFHLLLGDQPAFHNVQQAMIKTIVWMIGDLAYDDTFLKDDSNLLYPIMANMLFIVFVTVIGGFIVNLVITQPSNKLDDFREKAAFHLAANRVRLFLRLHISFPFFKSKTVKFFEDGKQDKHHNFLIRKLLMLDLQEEAKAGLSPIEVQLQEQSKQINNLLTLIMEQNEEMQEFKHQLKIIVNKTLERTN